VPRLLAQGELINPCKSPATQGRLYALNILTGESIMDLDKSGQINDNDAFQTISASEIPGTPQRVFNSLICKDGSCDHKVDVRIGKKLSQVGFINAEEIESVYWSDPVVEH
jgi:hypothetical protein